MKAAIWYGGKDIRIEDVPEPEMKKGEVLVRVKAAGICGSELHAYEGTSMRRKPPLVMGHEFSGEVAEVGEDVDEPKRGERVVVDPITRCGICEQCMRGQGNVCRNMRLLGLHMSGAFAEYVSVPSRNCHKLPDNISFEEASMVEPLAVGVHAVNITPVKLGDTVVVIGPGVIGLMSLQAAKIAGAGRIIATGTRDYRLGFAKMLGADIVINAKIENPIERVNEETDRKGADVALEAVGLEATVQQAMKSVGIGGRVTVTGLLMGTMALDILDAVVKELVIKGSYGYTPNDFRAALTFIKDRRVNVKPLITGILPLEDAEKGFELLHEKAEGVLKVVLKP